MIKRAELEKEIQSSIKQFPVTVLLGTRQCGKTTISKVIALKYESEFFDLENPEDIARLSSPLTTLKLYKGLVILDEIQRMPELFNVLRVMVDKDRVSGKYLLLGSASPEIIKGVSESLAGRVGFIDMSGFSLNEVGFKNLNCLWFRGGFPESYLAKTYEESWKWRDNFIRSFLERDIPQLGIHIPAFSLRRFWTMIAHYHGQIWNASEFARSLGVSEPTVRRYLDILSGAYVVRQIQPWFENIKKRQVKSPKVYIRDSGILHSLLSLGGNSILNHPKLGASWEGFILEQILNKYKTRDVYYWRTHAGAELDILIFHNSQRIGFEIKYADAPIKTKSMSVSIDDLKLDELNVIYPGEKEYYIDERIKVVPARNI